MSAVETSGWCAARRALLLGVGVAGLAAVTGCGGDGDSGTAAPGSAASGGTSKAAPPPSPSATEDPFAGFPSGDVPPGGALIETKEVPVGGGVLVRDSKLVVQPKAGTFKAYSASCPHQGIMVQPPAPGAEIMQCPGHNSQFKVADGSLARGPATRGLTAIAVRVQKGYVVEQ